MSRSIIEVDLVGPDTEAADDDEILCFVEYFLSKFGLRSNSENVNVSKIQKLSTDT